MLSRWHAPQSTAALPVGTIIVILLIWGIITVPLTVFGGIAGKNHHVRLPLLPLFSPLFHHHAATVAAGRRRNRAERCSVRRYQLFFPALSLSR